ALAGTYMREPEREWRSRMGGHLLLHAAGWLAVTATVFYVPGLFLGGTVWAALVWAGGAAGAYFGRRAPAGGDIGLTGNALQWLVTVGAAVALAGLLGTLSLGAGYVLNGGRWPAGAPRGGEFLAALEQQGLTVLGLSLLGSLLLAGLFLT